MNESSGNLISLREYVERLHAQYWAAHAREHELLQQAIDRDRLVMNTRLEGMNEFRAQLDKQQSTFITRTEIRPLFQFVDRFWGVMAGIIVLNGFITTLVVLLLRQSK